MFERILLPLDGSALAECVLPHCLTIARASGATVYLLQVLDPKSTSTRPQSIDPFEWQIRKAEAETYLRGIAARFQEAGVPVEQQVMEGKAAEWVLELARTQNINLILLSSHGQSGISGWNVSSVVQKIIFRAQTSIMIIRAYQPATATWNEIHYRRILMPLDGSQRAEVVFPVATNLAHSQEAEILATHVIRVPEMPRFTPLSSEDQELIQKFIDRNRSVASSYLSDLQNRLDVRLDTRLLIGDNVGSTLHELAEKEAIDLVLMSAHGYSGGTHWPYGSTVASFIAYGSTPLLVVQDLPPGQIEPTQAEIAARSQGGR